MAIGLSIALTAAAVALTPPSQQSDAEIIRQATPNAQTAAEFRYRITVNGIRFAPGRAGPAARPMVWFAVDGAVPGLDDLTNLLMRPNGPESR